MTNHNRVHNDSTKVGLVDQSATAAPGETTTERATIVATQTNDPKDRYLVISLTPEEMDALWAPEPLPLSKLDLPANLLAILEASELVKIHKGLIPVTRQLWAKIPASWNR